MFTNQQQDKKCHNRRIGIFGSLIVVAVILLFLGYFVSNPYNVKTIGDIPLPHGYTRVDVAEDSYAVWLRGLPLKSRGTSLRLYSGGKANLQWLSAGVVDVHLLSNDEQCADVCMRLQSEYLYERGQYDKISFTALNGKKLAYTGEADRKAFESYMKRVFGSCNTTSLCSSLPSRRLEEMQIGDMFIYPHRKVHGRNHYGHAVLVADMAINNRTGKKIFLLVEGCTPACDIHILRNLNPFRSQWFSLDEEAEHMRFNVFRFTNKELMYYNY